MALYRVTTTNPNTTGTVEAKSLEAAAKIVAANLEEQMKRGHTQEINKVAKDSEGGARIFVHNSNRNGKLVTGAVVYSEAEYQRTQKAMDKEVAKPKAKPAKPADKKAPVPRKARIIKSKPQRASITVVLNGVETLYVEDYDNYDAMHSAIMDWLDGYLDSDDGWKWRVQNDVASGKVPFYLIAAPSSKHKKPRKNYIKVSYHTLGNLPAA